MTELHCSLKDTEYETQREQFEFIYKYIENLEEENQKLQEQLSIRILQLEEIKLSKRDYTQENILEMKLTLKENQQKEFIEYLEDIIKQNEIVVEVSKYGLPKNCSKLLIDFYKVILSKYKEIIGDDK